MVDAAVAPDPVAARRAARWALAACSLGFTVVQLDVSVVNVALTSISGDLGGSVTGLQWVVDAYTVAFAAFILGAGALGDRAGAKRVFVGGFVGFTLASAGCGLAPDLEVLIVARVVQGLGAAVLVPGSLTLLNHAYPEARERARAVGIWAAGASLGLSGGPLVGGALTAAFGWRAIFFINVPLGAAALVLTLRFATDPPRNPGRALDRTGQLLAAITLLALAGAVVEGGRDGFGSPLVLAGFGLALLAGAAFVVTEQRRADPMLPLTLFARRPFALAAALGLSVNVAFYGLIFVLSLYFRTARGYSPMQTGLAFAPATGVVFAANLLSGRVAARFGPGATIGGAGVAVAAGLLGLLVTGPHTAYLALVGQLMVLGAGIGLIVPAMTAAMLGSVERDRSGVAAGTLNTARQTGSVIGVALFGSFAAHHLISGLHVTLWVAAALALVAAGLGLGLPGGAPARPPAQ